MLSTAGKGVVDNLLDDIISLKQNALDRLDKAQDRLKCSKEDPRVAAFVIIFNHANQAFEILHLYKNIWMTKPPIKQNTTEQIGRVMSFTKQLFMSSMSVIEFSAKQSLALDPPHALAVEVAKTKRKWVYLSLIMDKSLSLGIIDQSSFQSWTGLIGVRNLVVHNNGIADKTESYTIGTTSIQVDAGKMAQGKIGIFVDLTRESIQHFDEWTIKGWP